MSKDTRQYPEHILDPLGHRALEESGYQLNSRTSELTEPWQPAETTGNQSSDHHTQADRVP